MPSLSPSLCTQSSTMNILKLTNEAPDAIKKMQMDLEAPLLENKRKTVEVNSVIPCRAKFLALKKDVIIEAKMDNDEHTAIVNGRMNTTDSHLVFGFLLGCFLQVCSLYTVGVVIPTTTNENGDSIITNPHQLSLTSVFALYFFSRYWVLVCLFLPPVLSVTYFRLQHKRAKKSIKCGLNVFFGCLRFQFGLYFGSLMLLSGVNFYVLAKSASLPLLLSYYSICVIISIIALVLLQVFVKYTCANVDSIEIVVNYDKDDEE